MKFIYVTVRSTPPKVVKLTTSNLTIIGECVLDGTAEAVAEDEKYIYVGGGGNLVSIKKIEKKTMTVVAAAPSYVGFIYSISIIGKYLYVGGEVTRRVWKIDTETMLKVGESDLYNGSVIRWVHALADAVYIGGNGQMLRLSLDNLSLLAATSANWNTQAATVDTDYLYTALSGYQVIRKFDKLTLIQVQLSTAKYDNMLTMTNDTNYVYISGLALRTVWKMEKTTLNKIAESESYGSSPAVVRYIRESQGYIFIGGDATQTIWKISTDTMTKVGESVNLLGSIRQLSIYPFNIPTPRKCRSATSVATGIPGESEWL